MSSTATALAAGWTLTDEHGAELPPALCVGSGQRLIWAATYETCPACGQRVPKIADGTGPGARLADHDRPLPPLSLNL